MLTTLEILELARKGLRKEINDTKDVLALYGYEGTTAQGIQEELDELKAKYKELERMIINEKDKMY